MTPATDFERLLDEFASYSWSGRVTQGGHYDRARAAVIAAYNELAAECMEQARLNGMGSEREAALRADRDQWIRMYGRAESDFQLLRARLAECEGGAP